MRPNGQPFDPCAILAALDRHGVSYIVIGAFARVIQGTEELTRGVDVVPSLRHENLRRLTLALEELGAERADGQALTIDEAAIQDEPLIDLDTPAGELKIVPVPAGTRGGYDDLRRAATREPIGKGLRPQVAAIRDLARMVAALSREQDQPALYQLRYLAELERGLTRGIER
jgi:hypothetical protein